MGNAVMISKYLREELEKIEELDNTWRGLMISLMYGRI
jgi:hypothetical protein